MVVLTRMSKTDLPPGVALWSTGTDAEIISSLENHYAGKVNLHDYWSIGDERKVKLNAMSSINSLSDTHESQYVTLVLTDDGGKFLEDGITECCFQVDQKDCLLETGEINHATDPDDRGTNVGGWKESDRRKWCNEIYYN